MQVAKQARITSQIRRFGLATSAAAMVDYSGVVISTGFGATSGAASAVGFLCGSVTAFSLNRRWTFPARGGLREIGLAALSYLATLFLVLSVNAAVLALWPMTGMVTIAWAFSRAVGVTANFLAQRFLVFV